MTNDEKKKQKWWWRIRADDSTSDSSASEFKLLIRSFQLKVTNSSVKITFSAAVKLTSPGILMACSNMEKIPQACFPTVDCFSKVICPDFQLTGNIWSVLLCSLLEKNIQGRQLKANTAAAHGGKAERWWLNKAVCGSEGICARPKTTSYCNVDYPIKLKMKRITASIKILTRFRKEMLESRVRGRNKLNKNLKQTSGCNGLNLNCHSKCILNGIIIKQIY